MRKLLLCAFACLFAFKSDAKTCFLPMSDTCFPASSALSNTNCPEGYATNLEQCMAPNATCNNGWWLDTTKILQFSGGIKCYLCAQNHFSTDCNEALTEEICATRGLNFSSEELCVGNETITCNKCVGTPCPEDYGLTADLTCDGSQHLQTFSQNALCGKCVCKSGYHTSINDCGSSGSLGWIFKKDSSNDACGKCEAKTCATHNLVSTCLTSNYTEHLHWLGDNQEKCYDCLEDELVCNDGYTETENLSCNATSEIIELQPSEPRCAKCVCDANKNFVSSCQQGFSCQSPVGSCVKVIGCAADHQSTPCTANLAQFGPYQLAGHTCWRCGPTCQSLGYQQSGSCSDPFDAESYVCNDSSPQTDAYGSICRTLMFKTCEQTSTCRDLTKDTDGTISCTAANCTPSESGCISNLTTAAQSDFPPIILNEAGGNQFATCYSDKLFTCQRLNFEEEGKCCAQNSSTCTYDMLFLNCTDSGTQQDSFGSYCRTLVQKPCSSFKCLKSTSAITALEDETGITCEVYGGNATSISFTDTPQAGDVRAVVRSQDSNSVAECYTSEIETCQSLGYENKGNCPQASTYDSTFFDCSVAPSYIRDFWYNYCHTITPKTCPNLYCNNLTENSDGTFVCTASAYCYSNGCLRSLTDDSSKTPVVIKSGTNPSDTRLCYTTEIKTCKTEGYQYEGSCPNTNTYDSYMYSCSSGNVSTNYGYKTCHKFEPKTCPNLYCNNLTENSDGTFVCTASAYCGSNGCLTSLSNDTTKTPVTVQSSLNPSDTKLCYSANIRTCQTEGYQYEGSCSNTNYDSAFYKCQSNGVSTNYGYKYCYKLEPKPCSQLKCNNLTEHDNGSFTCTAVSSCSGIGCLTSLNTSGSSVTVFNSEATDSTVCSANITTCASSGYTGTGYCSGITYNSAFYTCQDYYKSTIFGTRCYKLTQKTCGIGSTNISYCTGLFNDGGTYKCRASSSSCSGSGCAQNLISNNSSGYQKIYVYDNLNDPDSANIVCYSKNYTLLP